MADEFAFLNKSGESDIQIDLFFDYRTTSQVIRVAGLAQASEAADARCVGRYDQSFEARSASLQARDSDAKST